jgi:hypothetical protein
VRATKKDVDGRVKPGHDGKSVGRAQVRLYCFSIPALVISFSHSTS